MDLLESVARGIFAVITFIFKTFDLILAIFFVIAVFQFFTQTLTTDFMGIVLFYFPVYNVVKYGASLVFQAFLHTI